MSYWPQVSSNVSRGLSGMRQFNFVKMDYLDSLHLCNSDRIVTDVTEPVKIDWAAVDIWSLDENGLEQIISKVH